MPIDTDKPWHDGLTDKQRRFVEEYVKDQNGARAARVAGYSEHSDDEIAYENLRKPQIRGAIDAYLNAKSMSAAEAVHLLTQWGRGTLEHFIAADGQLDIESDQARAHIHLLKDIEQVKTVHTSETGVTETIRTKLRLNDPMTAVSKILEVHGRIIQRRDVTSAGKAIHNVVFYMPDNGRDPQNEQAADH
ncbi:terminase small subunit [Spirosoma sordidisoli]|uniref:terminase small subunit n=1 Tax=Spirosoma sordidisoli TaxID=2502893 RepID=UPI0013EB2E70|nr:terminase small subunit [Spirosoma sordidisoli]